MAQQSRDQFVLVLRVLNALIRVDDIVTSEEETFLNRLMDSMDFSEDERERVLEPIEAGDGSEQLRALSPPLLKGLVKSLVKASKSDGVVDERERDFVDDLARRVGISDDDMEHLWSLPGGPPRPSPDHIDPTEPTS